jgi:hypothetical protein
MVPARLKTSELTEAIKIPHPSFEECGIVF